MNLAFGAKHDREFSRDAIVAKLFSECCLVVFPDGLRYQWISTSCLMTASSISSVYGDSVSIAATCGPYFLQSRSDGGESPFFVVAQTGGSL